MAQTQKQAEPLITLCRRCYERMSLTNVLVEVPGSEGRGTCQSISIGPHEGQTKQYEYTSYAVIAMRRALAKHGAKIDMDGLRTDTRARYKGPWRER